MKGSTNASARPNIRLMNQQVTFSANTDDETNLAYPYRASVTDSRINHYMSATIIFSQIQASSGNFADFCQTYDGGVYIYAKTDAGTITIPAVSCDIAVNYVEMDNMPVEGSNVPITSNGVYNIVAELDEIFDYINTTLAGKQNTLSITTTTPLSGLTIQRYGKIVIIAVAGVQPAAGNSALAISAPNPVTYMNGELVYVDNTRAGAMYINPNDYGQLHISIGSSAQVWGNITYLTNDP